MISGIVASDALIRRPQPHSYTAVDALITWTKCPRDLSSRTIIVALALLTVTTNNWPNAWANMTEQWRLLAIFIRYLRLIGSLQVDLVTKQANWYLEACLLISSCQHGSRWKVIDRIT